MPDIRIDLVESEPRNFSDFTLIEGFPGMGLIGTIGAKYLIERLKFREHGYLDSDIFVPVIRIHEGMPVNPSRIYVHDKLKLIILISEQIIPKAYTTKIAKAVVDWVRKKGIKRIISLSGIHTEPDANAKNIIYGIATSDKTKALLKQHGVEIIEDGITTGVTAMILLQLKNSEIEAISIMGNVNIAADYRASAELVKKLDEILGLDIDVSPLLKEAKETEQELRVQMERMKDAHDASEKFEGKPPLIT
ncbi:MAG TPA: proteasome assembly chaperone family protein [Candidatus Diapherotrites archaeon]|uniref:Proteasome assembly chaperone family protein n=1 Tax=Candidatus Iainarchaeum sp. TaxID=3101447 RepID=A0A7J4JEF2_9ARCH|nr:proteasome assembly chaperone family protein [Candidatus Diapherotrites archaeon]